MEISSTQVCEGRVRSYVTRRQLIGVLLVLVPLFAAYVVAQPALQNVPPSSAAWFWLDAPAFGIVVCLAILYRRMWRHAQQPIVLYWREGNQECEIAQGPYQGTWKVLRGPRSRKSGEIMAAVILVAVFEMVFFAAGIAGLLQAHDAREAAQNVQLLCEACFPGLLVVINWPYAFKGFRYVADLHRGSERMTIMF